MRDEFIQLADDFINDEFAEFKEQFEFTNILDTEEYNEDTGQYDKIKEYEFCSGIPLSISKDLLASGIYRSSDISVLFYFNDVPDFIDIGTEAIRVKNGNKYTVAEYIPDVADATVKIILKGVK